MYTIGQVSKMFNLPISTLRYYDNEGLFPNIARSSGIRKFSDHEIETLNLIECLKTLNSLYNGVMKEVLLMSKEDSYLKVENLLLKKKLASCKRL